MATNETLTSEQQIEALKQQLAAQEAENQAKDAIIVGQAEALATAEAQGQEGRLVITHDKKQYRVLVRQFDLAGETVKAEALKADKELVAKLLKLKVGFLQLIEKVAE